jgi:hypothetical protein
MEVATYLADKKKTTRNVCGRNAPSSSFAASEAVWLNAIDKSSGTKPGAAPMMKRKHRTKLAPLPRPKKSAKKSPRALAVLKAVKAALILDVSAMPVENAN